MDHPVGQAVDEGQTLDSIRVFKQMAFNHPLARGKVDPAFRAAMMHKKVDWTHPGR